MLGTLLEFWIFLDLNSLMYVREGEREGEGGRGRGEGGVEWNGEVKGEVDRRDRWEIRRERF